MPRDEHRRGAQRPERVGRDVRVAQRGDKHAALLRHAAAADQRRNGRGRRTKVGSGACQRGSERERVVLPQRLSNFFRSLFPGDRNGEKRQPEKLLLPRRGAAELCPAGRETLKSLGGKVGAKGVLHRCFPP